MSEVFVSINLNNKGFETKISEKVVDMIDCGLLAAADLVYLLGELLTPQRLSESY